MEAQNLIETVGNHLDNLQNDAKHDTFDEESWDTDWMKREYKSDYQKQMEMIEGMNKREYEEQYGLKESLSQGSKQLNWKTLTEFPSAPLSISLTPLQDYLSRISKGAIFCKNQYGDYPVYDAAMSEDGGHLAVITKLTGVKDFALTEIAYQDGAFIHKSIRTFFKEDGAVKYFTLSLGRDWTGGDVFDDYC